MNIPTISSMTSVPKTNSVNFFFFKSSSSKALMIMVVELMESMPPRNMLSMTLNPSSLPAPNPNTNMPVTSTIAVIMAVLPTLANLCKLNSSPKWNIKKIIPISLHVSIVSVSTTVGKKGKYVLKRKPANIYPSTKG